MKIITALLFLAVSANLLAQTAEEEITSAIAKVEKGQYDEVRKQLPDLISKYQNNAGIMYLQGRLATDGIEAVKFYQSVVDNFPKSQWAEDALYRAYQYYYSLGLYRTAELKMQQLKKDYPDSPHLKGREEAKLPTQEEKPVNLPTKEAVSADTQAAASPAKQAPAPEPYALQVGAFSTSANADKQKSYFEDLGYTVEVVNKIRGGRSLYLVWVGSFKTADEALRSGREIKTKYKIDSIIVERY